MTGEPIEKVLVANRGEIAARVIAACRAMGVAAVAVYSDPDAEAPYLEEADEAVALGGATAAESYLSVEKLIEAATRAGADAVHPGYGFLAENADFARAVSDAGLRWIGPPPAAIETMGSKLRARGLMEEAGVPILPGVALEEGADPEEAAERIGYPLLVKASAGGGGKGMRSVEDAGGLADAIEGARREAEAAFGDGTLFLERLLERPRHVEIQVFADQRGDVVSLGERECSIQRRHQKVIEEAPSPAVDAELRERMGAAAVEAARAVDYVGAGTVEFMLDSEGGFYFLEMNTRLQVEHPVTELVTGLDLVRLQLLVAMGERLPAGARETAPQGHAIEARLYAEDPRSDYLPQPGTLVGFRFPEAEHRRSGSVLRIDSGVRAGSRISAHYDPLLAKVIVWAPSRLEAARRLAAVLAEAELHGVITNQDFLVRTLREPDFLAGRTDTEFIDRHDGLGEPLADARAERLHAAAAALLAAHSRGPAALGFAPSGWRNNRAAPQRRAFLGEAGELHADYAIDRDGLALSVDGEPLEAAAVAGVEPGRDGGWIDLVVEGVRRRYRVLRVGETHYVSSPLGHSALRELPRYASSEQAAGAGALIAPMPGKVIKLAVDEGAEIGPGEVVAVLEAMKMEHELTAPAGGKVAELRVVEGDQVDSGEVLGLIDDGSENGSPDSGSG